MCAWLCDYERRDSNAPCENSFVSLSGDHVSRTGPGLLPYPSLVAPVYHWPVQGFSTGPRLPGGRSQASGYAGQRLGGEGKNPKLCI